MTFRDVRREYSGRYVLDGASFELSADQKVGLIGPNGSGKTTILRLMCGQEQPTSGNIVVAGAVRIGYVPQHVEYATDVAVRDFVLTEQRQLQAELQEREARVARADEGDMAKAMQEYQRARDAYDHIGGDHFEGRADAMLDALGLAQRAGHSVAHLSGGEKNVLGMAMALLAEPTLLILDEPGNHLDYMGLAWLEEFLVGFRGAVLIVSHNRYLLDRVATGILELDDGKVTHYPGNYSMSREIRAERLRAQQAQYESQQKRISQLEALVEKFGNIAQGHASDNTWGKRLRARRSQLQREKDKAIDKPVDETNKVSASFRTEPTRADIALRMQGYSKAFGELVLFEDVHWDVAGGRRWALVGPNGCGKTTMLRDIVQHGRWEHDVIRLGPSFTIGYCSQEQEVLNGDNTVYEELLGLPGTTHESILGLLARFLFMDEEVNKKVRQLSGGERNRLQLARLMLLQPNFLILDEPTNHLDIPTREAVEEALLEFKGTLLVVSHDRYFLDRVVDHVADVRDRGVRLYDGNFTSFWESRRGELQQMSGRVANRRRNREQQQSTKDKSGGLAWQDRKMAAAAVRKARKTVAQLEKAIAEAERRKGELEQATAAAYSDGHNEHGNQLSQELGELTARLEELYERWTAAGEEVTE